MSDFDLSKRCFHYPHRLVAHRGGGFHAPENTLVAVQTGFELGFHAVEFDVMLTRDEQLILMHDIFPGRTIAAKGEHRLISEAFDFEEITSMDAGSWFLNNPYARSSRDFTGINVSSFRDVTEYCNQHDIWMNVEIKPCPGYEHRTGELTALFVRDCLERGMISSARTPLLSSFALEALQAAKAIAPSIPRALLVEGDIPSDILDSLVALETSALHVNHRFITKRFVSEFKANTKLGLLCYTVNDVSAAQRLFEWGVDAVCTDTLGDFQSLLG